MKTPRKNKKPEKINAFSLKKEIVGTQKSQTTFAESGVNLNTLFTVVGILLVLAIVYLAFNR